VHTYVHEAVDSGGVDRLKELVGQYPEVLGYVLDPAVVVMLIYDAPRASILVSHQEVYYRVRIKYPWFGDIRM